MGIKNTGPDKSDFKLLEYVLYFIKEPVEIDYQGMKITRQPVSQFKIKPTFWLEDHCNCCGRCCKNYGMAYFSTEIEEIQNSSNPNKDILLERLNENSIIINNEPKLFYYEKPVPEKICILNQTEGRNFAMCPYIEDAGDLIYYCAIHDIRSFTCKFPHIRFTKSTDYSTISMGTAQYGRNHMLKCYAAFTKPTREGIEAKLRTLEEFYEKSKYLGLNTWLPEIIQFIKKNTPIFVEKGFPNYDIIFTLTKQRKLF